MVAKADTARPLLPTVTRLDPGLGRKRARSLSGVYQYRNWQYFLPIRLYNNCTRNSYKIMTLILGTPEGDNLIAFR